MNKTQYLNYAAICLLEDLGVINPTQAQIDTLEEGLHNLLIKIRKKA